MEAVEQLIVLLVEDVPNVSDRMAAAGCGEDLLGPYWTMFEPRCVNQSRHVFHMRRP